VIEVYPDEGGEWRYRVKGNNGQIVAVSEGYGDRYQAERGVHDLVSIVMALAVTEFRPQVRVTEQ
jgi:uncharacterized protein YegP (UPF0339 family)